MAAEQRWHPISPYQQTESKAFYGKIYQGMLNNFFYLLLKTLNMHMVLQLHIISLNLGHGDITNSRRYFL